MVEPISAIGSIPTTCYEIKFAPKVKYTSEEFCQATVWSEDYNSSLKKEAKHKSEEISQTKALLKEIYLRLKKKKKLKKKQPKKYIHNDFGPKFGTKIEGFDYYSDKTDQQYTFCRK